MDDLISRQAAMSLAKDICVPTKDGAVYRHRCIDPDDVLELPSAVVRCKDCIHAKEWKFAVLDVLWCEIFDKQEKDFFCAYGERRDPDA